MDPLSGWWSRCIVRLLVLLVAGIGMAGCAGSFAGSATEARGWKTGRVSKIVKGRDLKHIWNLKCVAPMPSEQVARSRFAVVSYDKGRAGRQLRTVVIPDSPEIKVGDVVRINLRDCAEPVSLVPQ